MSRSRRSGHVRHEPALLDPSPQRQAEQQWAPAAAAPTPQGDMDRAGRGSAPADTVAHRFDAGHTNADATATSGSGSGSAPRRYRIAIVSDFFYPRLGGVELHQYSLAQALMARGHTVIVITGTYAEGGGRQRQGVRVLTRGLKVYYLPLLVMSQQASLPTLFANFALLRSIFLRERIQLVHGHQSTSALAHEALMHARTMGLAGVFTDHSLFSFANAPAIHLNKLMKFTLSHTSHVICVSHCSKDNLCLRAYLDPADVSVIPNAVDTTKLTPMPGNAPNMHERFTIVVLSRLVYRKGMDLLLEVIPRLCAAHPSVHFLIGGDGPKRALLDQMREQHALQDRVEMLGAVAHRDVRHVLSRGHLFLNCSLTEAFCIAILEAVSMGLFVVSTRVGGVPEILPPDLMAFAEPNVEDLLRVLTQAIAHVQTKVYADVGYAQWAHARVRDMYNWHDVARRTEAVYARVLEAHWEARRWAALEDGREGELAAWEAWDAESGSVSPSASCVEPYLPLSLPRLAKLHACGLFAGPLFVCVALLDHLLWIVLRWWAPAEDMDVAPSMAQAYAQAEAEAEAEASADADPEDVGKGDPNDEPAAPALDAHRSARGTSRENRR